MKYENDNFAQRFLVPLYLREITSDLAGVVCQLSRVASSFISAGVRETGMAGIIGKCGRIAMPVLIGLLCLLPNLTFAAVAKDIADDPVIESRMIHLAEKVRCLVCQSEPVATSHSEWSQDVRNIMRAKMKAGATDQQILDMLVERFGKSVLYDPPVDNETMPLWGAPFVMLALGGMFLFFQLKKRRALVPEAVLSSQDEQRASTLLNESVSSSNSSKREARSPHLNPDGTTSHSTKLPNDGSQVAGYLPQGDEANASLGDENVKDNQA
jgi:cytochrome c-type biogenesis protein CcmH